MTSMRDRMVAIMAEHVGTTRAIMSEAMHLAWEGTKDDRSGASPATFQPDMADPAHALAHRVQMALTETFEGEPLFPCVVVVQHVETGRIGIAATAIPMAEAAFLLQLGVGCVRRQVRQFGT